MDFKSTVVMMFISTCVSVYAMEKKFNTNGVYVQVMEKGATMMAARSEEIGADDNKVTVTFLEISELVSSDGSAIPDKTVDLSTSNFTLTDRVDGQVGTVDAYVVTATSSNVSPVTEIKIYIFKNDGELNIDGEKTKVLAGDVKFTVKVSGYTFSTSNMSSVLEMKVKVKGTSTTKKSKELKYDLGNGSTVKLSKKVKNGDQYSDMQEQFPKLDGDTFVFRFPRFNSSVIYDPVISIGLPEALTFNAEGVYVKALTTTGAITVSRSKDTETDKVMLTMGEMREVDSHGVAKENMTFGSLIFRFDEVKDMNISGILASMSKATVAVMNGNCEVAVYIFKEAGVITLDGEKTTVEKGDVKVELKLSGYTLTAGNMMDIVMEVKGTAATPTLLTGNATGTDGKAYDLGKESKLFMSTKVDIDGEVKNITTDYPKLTNGAFVLRFPDFNGKSLTYDPIIRVGKVTQVPTTTPGTGSAATQMFNSLLVLFGLFLSQMFN